MATFEVGTGKEFTSLQAAINAASDGDTIVLTESISEATITIDGKDIAVDLGGFTFTGKTFIKNGADVVISNGKMTVAGNSPAFGDAVIKVMDGEVEVDGVKTVVPTSLELNGVEVDGGEAINSRYYTNAVTYDATGGLTVTDCTITAGTATRNADCESIGSISSGAVGIYAPNKSGGKIEITNSTITGGYGKTEAEWTGYVSQLFSPGGYGISLHGTSEVTITDSTVNGGGSNWYNAGYAINVSNQFSGTLDVTDSTVTGGNAEGQVGNYGQGGSGIYTNMSTSCESIDITGSTITGGAGGKSSNAFGIEYRNEDIKMNITESTVAAGNGEGASGGGAAIAIYNSESTQIVLDDVKLNGEGNGSNTVIKGGDKGVTVAGPVEITGGTLEKTNINVDATDLNGSEEIISGATGDSVQVEVSGNDDAVVITDGGKTYVTTETDPANADTSIIYVNNNWADKEDNAMVGVGKFMGVNAFADVNAAAAAAESAAGKLVVVEGANVTYTANQWYLLNTPAKEIETDKWSYDYVVDASETYDLQIDGTLGAYQVLLNNAETVVSSTGKLFATGETLRIMGGSITVEGVREANASAPEEIFTGSWGGGTAAGADTQVKAGYMQINQEAVAQFNNTVVFVNAGWMNFNDAAADFSNTYIYLGSGGSYAPIAVELQNGAEVTFADNTTVINDKTFTMNITVDATSTLTLDASSSITATTLTVADGGKFIIDAADFSGYKKVVDLDGTESLEGKVTINGEGVTAIYGEDGDIVLSTVDMATVFVNAEYTGEVGADLGNGKFFGVNAFADFESAIAAASANTNVTRIEIESDLVDQNIEYTSYNDIAQKLTIGATAGKKFTVDLGAHTHAVDSVAIRVMGDGASLTIEDGVTMKGLDVVADGFATTNEEMIINGEVHALSLKVWTSNNGITVNETGKVVLGYGDGQLDLAYGNGFLTVNGTLTDTTDDSLTDGPQFKAGYSGTRGNGNIINLNNTYFEGGAGFSFNGSNGTVNMDNSVLKVSGGDAPGKLTLASSGNEINVDNGSRLIVANVTVGADNTISVDGGALEISNLTNNGAVEVSGESTLNVATLSGNTIDLMDGAIVKDSTVGGGVFVAGDVTFRGDNTFGMLSDFGTLTDYYGTTAPMAWTVEAGASVTLTNTARYGLGYGDKVVVNGEIAANGAAAARATLTDDDADNDVKSSLFMHGLVAQESPGWNCDSSFTVNNAFVTIGSNNSFGSKSGNYGGNYTFSFNNSVLNASRITFYNTNAKTTFTLTGSDVEIGQFMTRDQDSVFTLDNTNFLSTATSNGTDEGNYNAAELNVTNGSTLTYSFKMFNEATGVINVDNATFVAPEVENSNEFNVSGESTIKAVVSGNGWIYMNDATLDADTKVLGANVRFASGNNVVDGAVIKDGRFQVGTGTYQTPDANVDTVNGVTVTVKNNAQIGGIDTSDTGAPYGGWIGSAYYDSFEDKQAAMTDARYTLNIENSIANFGYMHVSHDGILNVTGNADEKASYTGVDYSYYSGFFNVNGVATFDDVDVLTLFVNVSSDNDTENPGKLVIKNGTNFVSWRDSSTTDETFKISKTGIVEVDNAKLDSRHGTVIAEKASLIVKNSGEFNGNAVTNNGTIDVNAGLVDIKTLSNFNEVNVSGGTLNAKNMDLLSNFKLTGLTAGEARTITVAFMPEGASEGGFPKQIEVAANATSVNVNFTDVADGKYNLNVIDGTNVFTATTEIVNGTLDVTGGKLVLDALNIGMGAANVSGASSLTISKLDGTINLTDAVLSASSVAGGKLVTFGDNSFSGTNNIATLNVGYPSGYEISEATSVAITGNYTGGAIVVGSLGTMNIGAADADRTDMFVSGTANWINGSTVTITNADVEIGNALSMTGDIALDDANLLVTWEGQMNAGNGTGKVVLTNGSTLEYTSYFYIGGYYETGKAELNVTDSAVTGTEVRTSDKAVITLDNGDLTATTKLNLKGSIAMDVDSTVTFAAMNVVEGASVTLDMSNLDSASGNTLFDYTGSDTAAWDLDAYKDLISNWDASMDKFLAVENGDLIVKATAVAFVNSEFTDEDLAAGNKFLTHDKAVEAGFERIITTGGETLGNIAHDGKEAVVKDGEFIGTVSGGTIHDNGFTEAAEFDNGTDLVIEGGEFKKVVMGGDRLNNGFIYRTGDANLTIDGGTFEARVAGGSIYAGNDLKSRIIHDGDINLTINGGNFNSDIYGGHIAKGIYGGVTLVEGDITVTIDAAAKIDAEAFIVAGSWGTGIVDGDTNVVFTGVVAEGDSFLGAGNTVWGGSASDGYKVVDGERVFQTTVTGARTITFDDFAGDFGGVIRGFDTFKVLNDSDVTVAYENLSDILTWEFDADSDFRGAFGNIDGDDLIINGKIENGWELGGVGEIEGMFDSVKLNGVGATFDGSVWTAGDYTLEIEDNTLKFSALA